MDKLLKLLSENSGFTTAEIAAMLGEPEDYIKAQIKEYENSGVIKGYQAVVNWDMVDDSYVEALIICPYLFLPENILNAKFCVAS